MPPWCSTAAPGHLVTLVPVGDVRREPDASPTEPMSATASSSEVLSRPVMAHARPLGEHAGDAAADAAAPTVTTTTAVHRAEHQVSSSVWVRGLRRGVGPAHGLGGDRAAGRPQVAARRACRSPRCSPGRSPGTRASGSATRATPPAGAGAASRRSRASARPPRRPAPPGGSRAARRPATPEPGIVLDEGHGGPEVVHEPREAAVVEVDHVDGAAVDEQVRQPQVGVDEAVPVGPTAVLRQARADQLGRVGEQRVLGGPPPMPSCQRPQRGAAPSEWCQSQAKRSNAAGRVQLRVWRCMSAVSVPSVSKSSGRSAALVRAAPGSSSNRTAWRSGPARPSWSPARRRGPGSRPA